MDLLSAERGSFNPVSYFVRKDLSPAPDDDPDPDMEEVPGHRIVTYKMRMCSIFYHLTSETIGQSNNDDSLNRDKADYWTIWRKFVVDGIVHTTFFTTVIRHVEQEHESGQCCPSSRSYRTKSQIPFHWNVSPRLTVLT